MIEIVKIRINWKLRVKDALINKVAVNNSFKGILGGEVKKT